MRATVKRGYDARAYGRLLSRTLPAIIESKAENERMLAEVERLMDKANRNDGKLAPEEDKLLRLMVRLIEDFEREAYPINDATPNAMLRHLMDARDLKQRDLLLIFGSRGRVSEAVTGKRLISKTQAKNLAAFFNVSADIFL